MAIHLDPDVKLRAVSVHELDRMIGEGIMAEDDRIELLQGALVETSPQSPEHAAVLSALIALLAPPAREQSLRILAQAPLDVGQPFTRPEPDLALVPRPIPGHHATDAVLVVEVSISSRAVDLGAKAAIYAQAGVGDYWVVDVAERELVVHREPVEERFRLVRRVAEGDEVTALALPVAVAVADILADVPHTQL